MRYASCLVVAVLTAGAQPLRAQTPTPPAAPVQRLMRYVRVQLKPVTGMDTTVWFFGEYDRTRAGCTYVTTQQLSAQNGHFTIAARPVSGLGWTRVSLDLIRSAMTREHEQDPWQVVDPAWMDRASVCAGRSD